MKKTKNFAILILSLIISSIGLILAFGASSPLRASSAARAAGAARADENFLFADTVSPLSESDGWVYGEATKSDFPTAPADSTAFTLSFNGNTIASNELITIEELLDNYKKYVNNAMPAGEYVLSFTGSENSSIEFSVRKRSVSADSNDLYSRTVYNLINGLNNSSFEIKKTYNESESDLACHYLVGKSDGLKYGTGITDQDYYTDFIDTSKQFGENLNDAFYITRTGTVWEDDAYNGYFKMPELQLANTEYKTGVTGSSYWQLSAWQTEGQPIWKSVTDSDTLFEAGEHRIAFYVSGNDTYEEPFRKQVNGQFGETFYADGQQFKNYYYTISVYHLFNISKVELSPAQWTGDSRKAEFENQLREGGYLFNKYEKNIYWNDSVNKFINVSVYTIELTLDGAPSTHQPDGTAYCVWIKTNENEDVEVVGRTVPVTAKIIQGENGWKSEPRITGWTYNSYNNNYVPGEPQYVGNGYEYKVDGVSVDADNFTKRLAGLGEGNHTAVIILNETDNYRSLIVTISFYINPKQSEWETHYATASATYGINPGLKSFTSNGGSIVYNADGRTYSDIGALNAAIQNGAFDVGSYTVTVSVADSNYTALNDRFTLTINPAPNAVTKITVEESYTYGTQVKPTASALYGNSFTFVYEKEISDSVWEEVSSPAEVGEYRVKATVAAIGNYASATSGYINFKITRANATISGLTMGNFLWNGYDRATFVAATTNSPSSISYSIYSGAEKQFDLSFDGNGLPDDKSVANMNGLVAGAYRLVASTAQTANYSATSTGTEAGNFTVSVASNGWIVTPNIRSWVHYEFDDGLNMPYAVPQYGNVSAVIKNADGVEIYSGTITVSTVGGEYVFTHTGNTAGLWNAPGGQYTLSIAVGGEEGKYEGLTPAPIIFDVFTGSSSRPQNYWEEVPSIESWTSEFQDYTLPAGLPNRWTTVTHRYYEAERTQNGFVAGEEVLATVTRTKVGAGSPDEINVEGTMPVKPGWYMAVYDSVYADGNGTVYEADALSYTVYFQVLEAENSWIETPSIESWVLSSAASVPVTGTALYDSDYVIAYRPLNEPDAVPSAEQPSLSGRYVMIVTAKAKLPDGTKARYCEDITAEVVFNVSLATNEWIVLPYIEDWSEEFSDLEHTPVAEAKEGTVKFYYYDSNHNLLDEQPKLEGTYYMVAVAEADGYETLSSEVEFSITPAWDETLLIIDIVLGLIACAVVIVAIILAKRSIAQC